MGITRIMVCLLVLFVTNLPCEFSTVEYPAINCTRVFFCVGFRNCFRSVIFHLQIFHLPDPEPPFHYHYSNFDFCSEQLYRSCYIIDIELLVLIIFFCICCYGLVVASCCGWLCIVFNLLVGLGKFGLLRVYVD